MKMAMDIKAGASVAAKLPQDGAIKTQNFQASSGSLLIMD